MTSATISIPVSGSGPTPSFDGRLRLPASTAIPLLDSRIYMHFYATGITPAMAVKNVGKGSQYAIAYLDKDGNALDGSKTYKIHLPKDVPAKDFWSFTLYDNQTRGMLQTDQRFPGVDSNKEGLKQNADGSYRRLLRSQGTRGAGEQLDPDRPKQGVEHHPPPLWPAWMPSMTRPGSQVIRRWLNNLMGKNSKKQRFQAVFFEGYSSEMRGS